MATATASTCTVFMVVVMPALIFLVVLVSFFANFSKSGHCCLPIETNNRDKTGVMKHRNS